MRARHAASISTLLLSSFLAACGGDDAASSSVGADGGSNATIDGGSTSTDGGGSGTDGGSTPGSPDAGSDAASPTDEPFACTPVVPASPPDPSYVLGGATPAPQGGTIQPGLYRAVKGTHTYVEASPGDCTGVTPPPVTPYRTELDVRPTHYLLRVMSTNASGTWTTSGAAFETTQTCPDPKPKSGIGYTANGTTLVLYGSKQDYTSGGCHFTMQYELQKQ